MNKVQLGNISTLQRRKRKEKKKKNRLTGNRTQVNRMKDYYVHHYAIHAVTPNLNYCLGFNFFSPMKIFFDRKKLSVIYKKKWNCFFLCNFKTCRIL